MKALRRCTARIALLAVAATLSPHPARAQASTYELLQTFSDLLNQIRVNYVDSVTTQHLVRGAIEGMLNSLDPHSYYLPHERAARLQAWDEGKLGTTGILVETVEGATTVAAVLAGSPAERAHVSPGDRIVAVNDTAVAGLGAKEVQSRLVGERGSKVRLTLERGPRQEPDSVSVTLRNENLQAHSVTRERTLAGGIGYVQLGEFGANAGRELRDAIDRVASGPDARRVILDLRGNPGGLISGAFDVLSLFLDKGQMAFRTIGRHPDANSAYPITRDGRYHDARLVVLIDGSSASASEAVAGSLQDHDRAVLMGRRSFGKALVQTSFLVQPSLDVVMLTIAHVVTPSGRIIQRSYSGLSVGQYETFAGKSGAPADTATAYRTDGGRLVRGGGGIVPDSELPAPASVPVWFLSAADSGFDDAVSDSVAQAMPRDSAARAAWVGEPSQWPARLLLPLRQRVQTRLHVPALADSARDVRIARAMAARVAGEKWGEAARVDLLVASDPDIAAAVSVLSRPAGR